MGLMIMDEKKERAHIRKIMTEEDKEAAQDFIKKLKEQSKQ